MNRIDSRELTFDRIAPLAAMGLLTLLFCMTRYADYDLWWHLKLGETIIAERGIPWRDTFSYTVAGRGQFTGEWLADALIFLVFKAGGFLGINLLKAALISATLTLVWLQIREAGKDAARSFAAAVITLLLVLFAIRFRLFVRPYLFSLPFLAAFLYLLERWRNGTNGREIYLLPVMMLFWANMSVGAVFGLFAVGLAAAVDLIGSRSWRLLPVLLLSILASLANPETYRLYTLAIDLTSDPYRALIGEYQPVTADILFGTGLRYTLWFQILAVGGSLYFLVLGGWKNLFRLTLFAFLLFESFRQIRLVELFSLVAAVPFGLLVSRLLAVIPAQAGRLAAVGNWALAVSILALIPASVFKSPVYAFGVGPKTAAFPDGALKFLQDWKIIGKMFNSYGFGGYIIWRGEGRKVFIDGRYRRVYTPEEYGEYKGALESAEAWRKAEQKHGFDYAVLEYDLLSRRFPGHLVANPDWALVYWDNYALVYVKRTPERAAMIAAREYRVARPAFLDFSYLDAHQEKGTSNEALAAIEREVALNPDNQFVVLARVYLRYQLGMHFLPQIRADLERILPMKPDFAMKHSALAMVLANQGEADRAVSELKRALKLDPFDAVGLAQARSLGIKVKMPKGGIPGHP